MRVAVFLRYHFLRKRNPKKSTHVDPPRVLPSAPPRHPAPSVTAASGAAISVARSAVTAAATAAAVAAVAAVAVSVTATGPASLDDALDALSLLVWSVACLRTM